MRKIKCFYCFKFNEQWRDSFCSPECEASYHGRAAEYFQKRKAPNSSPPEYLKKTPQKSGRPPRGLSPKNLRKLRDNIARLCAKNERQFNPGRAQAIERFKRKLARHEGAPLPPKTPKAARPPPITTKPERSGFFESRVWQELRYRALKHYGVKCMCCGITSVEMHVDHIKPRSKYPTLELQFDNLQVLCRACNMGKSNTDETDWRPKT